MSTKLDPNQNNKTNTKTGTTKRKKRRDWSFYVIIVSLIIIAIPASFLGYHIISATTQTGKPIFGNRFKGDLSAKIEEEHLVSLEKLALENPLVESAEYSVISATLRANVLLKTDAQKEDFAKVSESLYENVNQILPLETYFTKTSTEKMYDFELNVYNTLKPSEENPFIYYMMSKSSSSENVHKQFMSESAHPDFIESLIDSQTATQSDEEKDVASDS